MLVVIPSIGESPYLPALLRVLADDPEVARVLIVDNSPTNILHCPSASRALEEGEHRPYIDAALSSGRFVVKRNPNATIYSTWNFGISQATDLGTECAVLNDDIVLPPRSLSAARHVMVTEGMTLVGLNYSEPHREVSYDAGFRHVYGTYRTGGFGGFAFVLAPGAPLVDIRFQWWYGDDDLAERVKLSGGRMAVALGAPVDHPQPSLTGNAHPWTQVAAGEDTSLFRQLWPSPTTL